MARSHLDRRAAAEAAVEVAGGDVRRVFVMFEQHDHMPLDRGTAHDRYRGRAGQSGAPMRGPKQIHGMGKAYGRWEETLAMVGIREAMCDEVKPNVWRARFGIKAPTSELLKQAAVELVKRIRGVELTHDVAEGYLIADYAAWDGLANFDGKRALKRAQARAKRAAASQGSLDLGPANDNGGRTA